MVFSSATFLFAFLPLALAAYFLAPVRFRNAVLLGLSLFFYAWGEVAYVAVMLASIVANFGFGRWIQRTRDTGRRLPLAVGVAANLALLGFFKYANFFADNLGAASVALGGPAVRLDPVHLPLGVSFFSFQAITFLVDVQRREADAPRRLGDVALYLALFPQLIAGPIVRFPEVAADLHGRVHRIDDFAAGARRFTIGLARKVLLANPLAGVADACFGLPAGELTTALAWIGLVAYALQIYFDFSGYSDMAIGLGRIFGFRFPENFDHPYAARSIRDFWRRWHLTLSAFFRDYVYIPLGGGRRSAPRVYANLALVFLLTGLWHGAAWVFVLWGLWHGLFLVLERAGGDRLLARLPRPVEHAYALAVVLAGWVLFRAVSLAHAQAFAARLLGWGGGATTRFQLAQVLDREAVLAAAVGLVLCTPLVARARSRLVAAAGPGWAAAGGLVAMILLGGFCVLRVAASTYDPFIYFRF